MASRFILYAPFVADVVVVHCKLLLRCSGNLRFCFFCPGKAVATVPSWRLGACREIYEMKSNNQMIFPR